MKAIRWKLPRMKRGETCLDCDETLRREDEDDEGHAGDPGEPYDEGFHICGKAHPRVVKDEPCHS